MSKKIVSLAVGMALSVSAGQLMAAKAMESTTVTCADLNWSAGVLAENPDIAKTCRTVFEKDGKLYAQASVEVVRVRGNTMTFVTLHTDGTKGESRMTNLESGWRATIGGREYRASDLNRGQKLNVYLPEDRFALSIGDDDALVNEMVEIEDSTEMPTTASPLFLIGLVGSGFLAMGGLLRLVRRRLA
jgi:hypothetical protein